MKIIVTSLWFPSAIFFQNLEFTHHFPSELKQCCEFPLTRDRDSYPPPCIDPCHIHLALGVQRWICAECNSLYKINLYGIQLMMLLVLPQH